MRQRPPKLPMDLSKQAWQQLQYRGPALDLDRIVPTPARWRAPPMAWAASVLLVLALALYQGSRSDRLQQAPSPRAGNTSPYAALTLLRQDAAESSRQISVPQRPQGRLFQLPTAPGLSLPSRPLPPSAPPGRAPQASNRA